MARALEHAVWAVRPDRDNLEDLVSFLGAQCPKFLLGSGTRCLLDLPTLTPRRKLLRGVRKNILLTVTEAFNNIAKHAHATEAWLRIRFVNPELTIVIEDNGRGLPNPGESRFQVEACDLRLASTGQGLLNMKKRMADFGGSLAIENREGGGTRIKLCVKL
jgi:signal transduction histidine kinase